MTALEMSQLLGKTGYLSFDGIHVHVEVLDARVRFGEVDVLVKPRDGMGQKWVRQHTVADLG